MANIVEKDGNQLYVQRLVPEGFGVNSYFCQFQPPEKAVTP